ncbi:MAG: DegV family protein [Anaerolineales bacterium]|uniref:DegV family protein n=1 Tax=Candidatus Villigracilis proximus TaxID=3140683 RepID=UPI0031363D65|nr:DegV family protein [Anaerolineales bacterium]
MKIGIVTDSTSDLPAYLVEEHQIQVVPTILVLEGKEYSDGIGITREEFYTRLPSFQTPPTTAAPSIGDFTAPYETLLSQGCDHIISIHSASQLTTIVNVARQAANEFPDKVTCIDSGSLSLGLGFQVLAAAEESEYGLQSVLNAIVSTRKRLQVTAALDTMEYLKRSGRVPGAVATLGGLLSIKPMIELIDGEVKPIGAVRTTSQADERILSLLLKQGELQRLAIMHTNAELRAKKLLDEMMSRVRQSVPRDILFVNVTAVIGTHLGPNGIGFAAVKNNL